MSSRIESRANALGAEFEPTRPVFDLSQESELVLDALARQTPEAIEALKSARQTIPLPKSAAARIDNHFYRLPNHNRSFCYSLAQSDAFMNAAVLVFKGCEPLMRDFTTMLDWMLQAPLRKSSRVMADHFPLAEGKIPGALSLKEATHEAQIALAVQKKHLAHYGELAKLPVPLLVHSMSEERNEACAATLRHKLSAHAFERIEPLLQQGLAIYVYYYPSAPIRANYWGDMAVPQLKQYIESTLDEDNVVAGWVRLIVRLLYLGYLPYSVRNEGLGACMDFGNAALDGGFCDPDSIVPIETNTDDEFFRESVIQSLSTLRTTVRMLLRISETSILYPSIEEFVCGQYLQQLLNAALVSEKRPDLRLDERFLKLMFPESAADVRLCSGRKNRIPLYSYYAKRLGRA